MTKRCLSLLILLILSNTAWAIYGPDLARTDPAVSSQACQAGNFQQSQQIARAAASGKPDEILPVLANAIKEWEQTPETSPLYPARAFCVHELVPSVLEPKGGNNAAPSVWST